MPSVPPDALDGLVRVRVRVRDRVRASLRRANPSPSPNPNPSQAVLSEYHAMQTMAKVDASP